MEAEVSEKKKRKKPWRIFAGAAVVVSIAAIGGQSILATLNATVFNTVAENVDAGTLKLKLTDNGAGFSQNISLMAPGDVVNRFVTLENDGSLEGQQLSLKTTQTGSGALITDGATTKALQLTVSSCSVPWTPISGNCSGTQSPELLATTIGSLTTPINLSSGSMSAGSFKYLKMSLQLPDQNETTLNGLFPPSTIQGQTVAITYTFNLAQRNATITNS